MGIVPPEVRPSAAFRTLGRSGRYLRSSLGEVKRETGTTGQRPRARVPVPFLPPFLPPRVSGPVLACPQVTEAKKRKPRCPAGNRLNIGVVDGGGAGNRTRVPRCTRQRYYVCSRLFNPPGAAPARLIRDSPSDLFAELPGVHPASILLHGGPTTPQAGLHPDQAACLGRESVVVVGNCGFPGFLRGLLEPRHATTSGSRPVKTDRPHRFGLWITFQTAVFAGSITATSLSGSPPPGVSRTHRRPAVAPAELWRASLPRKRAST